jgi:hypothetical protein
VLARIRRLARWSPLVLATALLAQRAISGILTKLGHPGASLDDAYIHFQYARAFAEGHPFRFQAGEPISTGATSFLWPLLLAPFYLIGFRGESILWPAWAMSFVALGALAYEAYVLALPLAGRPAAIGAGAMVLAFGGFAWGAASGMEVVPFAWLLAHGVRRAAEWAEKPEVRTRRSLVLLALVAVACPLMRPEGALIAIAIAIVVALFPRERSVVVLAGRVDASRVEALLFVGCALAPNLLLLLLTGHPTSSTTQVKLLFGNPYYVVADAASANARTLIGTILDGQVWSAEFLPKGGAPIACLGLAAIVWRAEATKYRVRGVLVLLLALMMFVPCLYVTFLWNRLRYLWPFATGWFIGLACLARAAQVVAFRYLGVNAKAGAATAALVSGACAGALAVRLEWVLEDAAQSASGIDRQQATLGRWAKTNLPADARIGVNDTGAIAYFGDRKTFDVVGLTTPSEGRYWVGGAASRLEHYERMKTAAGGSLVGLPTHFIVYPEWMACEPLLGRGLTEATVTDATILGGQTMRAVEAKWQYLGTGEHPWSPSTVLTVVHDSLDVADLESEAEHGYQLFGAREGEQIVHESNAPDGNIVLDGARSNRSHEHFFVKLPPVPPGGKRVALLRTDAPGPTTIKMSVGGKSAGTQPIDSGPWQELAFEIPAEAPSSDRVEVDVTSEGGPFASFHYWFGVSN